MARRATSLHLAFLLFWGVCFCFCCFGRFAWGFPLFTFLSEEAAAIVDVLSQDPDIPLALVRDSVSMMIMSSGKPLISKMCGQMHTGHLVAKVRLCPPVALFWALHALTTG